ncbi:MAG: hypothetical protein R3282_06600 [Rhodothermales bacterium]|nr:hypothetical protein [Rhodothermales bacterium]
MPCSISDGPQLPEDVPNYLEPDDEYDRELEFQIAEDLARVESMNALCAVCRKNYVDVMDGEDTCTDCAMPF